jgi:hypothetical protein
MLNVSDEEDLDWVVDAFVLVVYAKITDDGRDKGKRNVCLEVLKTLVLLLSGYLFVELGHNFVRLAAFPASLSHPKLAICHHDAAGGWINLRHPK